MARYVWTAVLLQLALVAAGHFVETALNLGGVLGALISFAVGVGYGVRVAGGFRKAVRAGVVIGVAGSAAGLIVAMLLGDATWMPLTHAPLAAAACGVLGVAVGRVQRTPAG